MKALMAACLALITLTGCAQTATFGELADGACTDSQGRLVREHIGAQITAISREDWESAYSYASPGFQESVSLEQFIFVISSQYQMLIVNQGVEFGSCSIASEAITQEVNVTSQSENYKLIYDLSYSDQKLGVKSALVGLADPQTNI
jgi:hypothetical protein